jgi:hypothetical protein
MSTQLSSSISSSPPVRLPPHTSVEGGDLTVGMGEGAGVTLAAVAASAGSLVSSPLSPALPRGQSRELILKVAERWQNGS